MRKLFGTGASSGIAVGPARLLPPPLHIEERRIDTDRVLDELQRFEDAIASTDSAMEQIGQATSAPSEVGTDLVDTHRAILNSDEIVHEARTLIRERSVGAEWAVRLVVDELRTVFAGMKDERFAARFEDVEAVANRLLRTLLSLPEIQLEKNLAGGIGVALELSPLDALQLHRLGLVGFATERGGPTSHGAIVARTLGIPYVFGVDRLLGAVHAGDVVCVDGAAGDVIIKPDGETERVFASRHHAAEERRHAVEATQHDPAVTRDGVVIQMGANIESSADVAAAIAAGADHIGLVRTELLYLDRRELPSEDEQLADALEILRCADGRRVTFRTLDIGGDKLPLSVRVTVGANPALGLRGIRFSLRRPDLFRTQLRALYRAAASGPLRIMFPLVSHADEVRAARRLCTEVCAELTEEGLPHDATVQVGAMIETPSAALTADHLAEVCDFLSIGTNDLIQYTFAADRQNEEMASFYRPLHPAILRLLRQILDGAARFGRDVSLCGDMAADPRYTWILIGLGLRALSMTARELPFVRSVVQKSDLAEAQRLADDALVLHSDAEVQSLTRARMGDRFVLEIDSRGPRS
jgi:phosphotransferase system enzyme I (PtsI)